MFKMNEACIVHSVHDYVFSMFLEKFMEWIGISCFNFTYHDNDAKLNNELKKNYFDFVLYINDKDNNWKNQYESISDVHVDINTNDYNNSIWCSVNHDTDEKKLNQTILIKAFENVINKAFSDSENIRAIFNFLAELFCKHNVLHKMLDSYNKYTLLSYDESPKGFFKDVIDLSHGWDKIITEMESHKNNFESLTGLENYTYALVYSEWKSMETYGILRWNTPYNVDTLLKELDSIYTYSMNFYMGESLKAKIMFLDWTHQVSTVFCMKNCIDACHTDACSSIYYYQMGTFYELLGRAEDAIFSYKDAYKKNPLNFRALFKITTFYINSEKFDEAEKDLKLILRILQIYDTDSKFNEDNLKYLPVLEMEYICKCLIILDLIGKDNGSGKHFYQKACKIRDLVKQSNYLKDMYGNNYKDRMVTLESYLLNDVLKEKLQNLV